MSVSVGNNGSVATSRATTVRIVDSYSGHSTLSVTEALPALASHALVNVNFLITINAGCGEAHVMIVRLDPDNLVPETSEGDNILSLPHTVAVMPNLYLTDLSLAAHPPCNGVAVSVRVNNNGSGPTPRAVLVRFTDTYSGAPGYSKSVYVSVPVVAAGTSRIVSQTFPNPLQYCNHTHTMTAFVDPDREIDEVTRSDNSTSGSFHPDL
jgi:hypothetical protein